MYSKKIENGMLITTTGEETVSVPTTSVGFKHKATGIFKTEISAPNEKALSMWIETQEEVITETANQENNSKQTEKESEQASREKLSDAIAEKKEKAKANTKTLAGVFGILLGGLGIHKFYLGLNKLGILYLVFCWTGIPGILGLVDGIQYLVATEEAFIERLEKEKASNARKFSDILPVLQKQNLPVSLALASLVLSLLGIFCMFVTLPFVLTRIFLGISTIVIAMSVAMELYVILKQEKITLKMEMIIQALAILILFF